MLWALFRLQVIRTRWAPHFCCVTCTRRLAECAKVSGCMSFAIPMVWRQPTDHVSDCYFWVTSITGVTTKSKHIVQYPILQTAIQPLPLSAELHVPTPPTHDAEWQWVMWWRSRPSLKYGLRSNFSRNQFFQWTTPADPRRPEWYCPKRYPFKKASRTFRLQFKGLEFFAPGH